MLTNLLTHPSIVSFVIQAMDVDHMMISETALKCITDCLLVFGFRPFHVAKVRPNMRITTEGSDEDDEDVSGDLCVL